MNLNADLNEKATARIGDLAWQPSPLKGVERRMLDREGGEVARATTIVRYAPESFFDPHTHGGGEEFLVLQGTFSDEHGDYPAGMYVRNPIGSAHKPFSEKGCTILVKLQQMDAADQTYVRIDTNKGNWRPGAMIGVDIQPLHRFGAERVAMVRLSPGAIIDHHAHPGGVELLIVDGAVEHSGQTYTAQSWLRFPPGETHDLASAQGALLFAKVGHLKGEEATGSNLLSAA